MYFRDDIFMKNVNFRDFSLILFETKPGRPDVKSGIFPTLVDSHGHNQQHSLQIRQHCWYCQETAESAENHSRAFIQFFKTRLNLMCCQNLKQNQWLR